MASGARIAPDKENAMDAYVYQAALLCADCAKERQYELELHNMWDGSKCALKAWPHTWKNDRPPSRRSSSDVAFPPAVVRAASPSQT